MTTIKIRDKEYALRFDLNALAEMQQKFGGIDAIAGKTKDLCGQKYMLAVLINEGIAYHNFEAGTHDAPITEQEIGMFLEPADAAAMSQKIIRAFSEAFPPKAKNDEKKTI